MNNLNTNFLTSGKQFKYKKLNYLNNNESTSPTTHKSNTQSDSILTSTVSQQKQIPVERCVRNAKNIRSKNFSQISEEVRKLKNSKKQ